MPILLAFLGGAFLLVLQTRFYVHKWSDRLSADIRFTDTAVNEGDTSSLTETITNRKALPLITLQAKFHVNKNLRFINEENTVVTDNTYRNDIFSLMSFEKIERKLPFVCTGRGYYQIQELDLISNDLFLTKKSILTLPLSTALYVYPRPVDHAQLDVPFQKMMGTILTKRYAFEDPFEFRGIRPYQTYDSMKDINWKVSAKTGDWKVNVHNYTSSQQVTIFLDLGTNSNLHYERIFEESIRIAASYAAKLITAGIPTRLVSNGMDSLSGQELILPYGAGESHIDTIKKGLSRLDSKKDAGDFLPFIQKELQSSEASSTLYVLISKFMSPALLSEYNALCAWLPVLSGLLHCIRR